MQVVVTGEPADRDACRQAALRIGWACGADDSVGPDAARLRLSREPVPGLVLAAVGPTPDWTAVRQTVAAAGGLPVYAVGPAGLPGGREQAAAVGAAGYLPRELLRDKLLTLFPTGPGGKRGRVVAVVAAVPGTGCTTVAAGLAFALAKPDQPVALVELTTATPELALGLDLEPPHSIAELIRQTDRMDAGMVRTAAARHPAGVDVLAYPAETLAAYPVGPRQVEDFLVLGRSIYTHAVFDLGHGPTPAARAACAQADAVVLLTRPDVPGIRLTRAFGTDLVTHGMPADRVLLAVNRYNAPGAVPWRRAAAALKSPVAAWLPDDPKAAAGAANVGRPLLLASNGRLCKRLREFARLIAARAAR